VTSPRPSPDRDPDELRKAAESRVPKDEQAPDATDSEESGSGELVHELRVHKVELELQNEELRRSQQETLRARDDLLEIFDFAPVGYVVLDSRGMVRDANLRIAEHLGTPRGQIKSRPFVLFMTSDSRRAFYEHVRVALGSESEQSCEVSLRRSDGSTFPGRLLSRTRRVEDDGSPRLLTAITDMTAIRDVEATLLRSLDEKDLLLKEMHHRVRNNLQVVSSLLALGVGSVEDPGAARMLEETRHRVQAMAMIHEELHQTGDLTRVDLAIYVRNLTHRLVRSFAPTSQRLALSLDLDPIEVEPRQAVPCGLILSELVSNALKYAFPGSREGSLSIRLSHADPGKARLDLRDDGIGLPDADRWREARTLGLRLVRMFEEQIGGTIAVETDPGTAFTLVFPLNRASGSGQPHHRGGSTR
jgi:PAS domain S-box-containing protein